MLEYTNYQKVDKEYMGQMRQEQEKRLEAEQNRLDPLKKYEEDFEFDQNTQCIVVDTFEIWYQMQQLEQQEHCIKYYLKSDEKTFTKAEVLDF